jgi:hypothetical protein
MIPVFPEWQGKDLDDILLECRDLVEKTPIPLSAAGERVAERYWDTFRSTF